MTLKTQIWSLMNAYSKGGWDLKNVMFMSLRYFYMILD